MIIKFPVSASSYGHRRARPSATDPRKAETGRSITGKDRKPGICMSFGVGAALVVLFAWTVLADSEPSPETVKIYRPVRLPSPYSSAIGQSLAQLAYVQGADQPYALPDPQMTPGAIRSTSSQEVCVAGYSRDHRVWHDRAHTLTKYGLPQDHGTVYEDDDLVPVCLGGDNADPRNHWAQSLDEAHVKDKLEATICRNVCAILWHSGPEAADKFMGAAQLQFQTDWTKLRP